MQPQTTVSFRIENLKTDLFHTVLAVTRADVLTSPDHDYGQWPVVSKGGWWGVMGVRVSLAPPKLENRSFQSTLDFFNYNNIMSIRKKGNVRRVKRTRGANGRCGATKTPSPTPQNSKGRVTMPNISELYRRQRKKFAGPAKVIWKKINGVLDSSGLGEQIYAEY